LSKTVRVDDLAYGLLKTYADEKGISMPCAIGEVMSCPIKSRSLSNGDDIPVDPVEKELDEDKGFDFFS